VDDRLNFALGDLYAYVLVLDAQRQRLVEPLDQLAPVGRAAEASGELKRQRLELAEELDALRDAIAVLRAQTEQAVDEDQ
jgi:hypothetical protein